MSYELRNMGFEESDQIDGKGALHWGSHKKRSSEGLGGQGVEG